MSVVVISNCANQACCFNRSILAYHVQWGFRTLDFVATDFFTSPNTYKKYLTRTITRSHTGTGGGVFFPLEDGTIVDTVDRITGVLTHSSTFSDPTDDGSLGGTSEISDTITSTIHVTTSDMGASRDVIDFVYTRTETLSDEYTNEQMYDDVKALIDGADYANPFGTLSFITETTYQFGTGDVVTFASSDYVSPTVAFYHHIAAGENDWIYYISASHYSAYAAPNVMFMHKFQSQVRMSYSIRENNTNNLDWSELLDFPVDDYAYQYANAYDAVYLPAINDTSCNVINTNSCTSSVVTVDVPTYDSSQFMLFTVLSKSGSCPQN